MSPSTPLTSRNAGARWTAAPALIALALALAAPAAAQPAPPKAAAPAAPASPAGTPATPAAPAPADPLLQAATKAFGDLDEDERKAVQDGLVWTGDYNGSVDGEFGRLSFEAIRAWQRKQKANATGILDEAQRKALKLAADKAKAAAKFAVITDGLGLRIGVPRAAAPSSAKAGAGTKYHSDKDVFLLETLSAPASGATLESLFDSARQATGTRKVGYRLLRPDFFVVAGEDKGRRFYLRMAKGPNGLRGYRLTYPVARAAEFDRLSIAIANSFEAFPGLAAAAPPAPAARPDVKPAPPPVKKAVLSGTGLLVAPGIVLTSSALIKSCEDPRIGGQPVKAISSDDGAGLALVDAPGARGAPWLRPPRSDTVRDAEDLVAPVALEGEKVPAFASATAVSAGAGARWRLQVALQTAALGAPIFDRRGALVGVVVEGRRAPFMVAGIVPASNYAAASAGALTLFARDNGFTFPGQSAPADDPQSAGAVAAAVSPSVMVLTCLK